MSKVTEAVDMFEKGYACSQAILAVYGRDSGLERATALRIASGFAAGMRAGETCGAVTGAFMALGLKYCPEDCASPERRQATYAMIKEFTARFTERNKTTVCKELLHCDLGAPGGTELAMQQGLFRTVCPKLVKDAAEILEDLMREPQTGGGVS